jgi:hypothetical protein
LPIGDANRQGLEAPQFSLLHRLGLFAHRVHRHPRPIPSSCDHSNEPEQSSFSAPKPLSEAFLKLACQSTLSESDGVFVTHSGKCGLLKGSVACCKLPKAEKQTAADIQ